MNHVPQNCRAQIFIGKWSNFSGNMLVDLKWILKGKLRSLTHEKYYVIVHEAPHLKFEDGHESEDAADRTGFPMMLQ